MSNSVSGVNGLAGTDESFPKPTEDVLLPSTRAMARPGMWDVAIETDVV